MDVTGPYLEGRGELFHPNAPPDQSEDAWQLVEYWAIAE